MWEWRDPKDTADRQFREAGLDLDHPRVRKFLELYKMAQDLPRHLGQHSGGMVICQGQLDSVVPLEPATMPGRVVVQWDKEDCADMGIIKVDLLGLGMMAVLEDSLETDSELRREVDLARTCRRTIRRFTKRCRRPTPSACSRWRAARRCRACRA
jgi:error-prone DNA polymerase